MILAARSEEAVRAAAAEIGGRAEPLRLDVADSASVEAAARAVLARHARVDILVNNAGIARDGLILRMKPEDWDAVMATNLRGSFLMCRHLAPGMVRNRWGRIVNIGSVVGLMGNAGQVNYAASKAGLFGLTRALARELASRSVTVNAVAPGYIASSGMDHYPSEAGAMLRAMRKTVPLGRFGTEAETSAAIVFLLSPAASFISGSVLRVDGARPQVRMGWSMGLPDAQAAAHKAVKPFDGFHRGVLPKVLAT